MGPQDRLFAVYLALVSDFSELCGLRLYPQAHAHARFWAKNRSRQEGRTFFSHTPIASISWGQTWCCMG